MKWAFYVLLGFSIYINIDVTWEKDRAVLRAEMLEARLADRGSCPKIPEPTICLPKIVTVAEPCEQWQQEPCQEVQECERCQTWWELCREDE